MVEETDGRRGRARGPATATTAVESTVTIGRSRTQSCRSRHNKCCRFFVVVVSIP